MKVILKTTDFKNDEILFSAFSPGGTSLASNIDLIAAETASGAVKACGVGEFSQIQLEKLLADRVVRVTPYINSLSEGLSGEVSPEDVEVLFQLVYLYFTSPRKDSPAFSAYKSRLESSCENRGASPLATFRDTITETITQNDPRSKPWTPEKLHGMDLDKSLEFYRSRFADASDFTFIFVGSFDTEKMRPLIETYLGGLPSLARKESWRNVMFDYPTGVIEKSVKKGVEPKSLHSLIFTGSFGWNRENRYRVNAMVDVLRIKLRQRIREELGGTYGVNVKSDYAHFPKESYRISMEFGSDPGRVEELASEVFKEIDP